MDRPLCHTQNSRGTACMPLRVRLRAAVRPSHEQPHLALSGALSRALCLINRLRSKRGPAALVSLLLLPCLAPLW